MMDRFPIRRLIIGIASLVLALSAVATQSGCANAASKQKNRPATPAAPWTKPGWVLTFHDEFNGASLDTGKWLDSYPHGSRTHGNEEQEYYGTNAYTVNGGQLHLIATKQPQGGLPYTSGMICSYGHFAQTYGWFEIRARFPAGKGMWPAFWLLPAAGTWPPEIDILEILGHEPNKVYFTTHWAAGSPQQYGVNWTGPNFSDDFHTFAVDWGPGSITWYVDGVAHGHATTCVPQEPMFIVANLAVGGGWPGNPDATTPFPATMDIDYIRVYRKADMAPERPFAWSRRLNTVPHTDQRQTQVAQLTTRISSHE